MITHVYFGDVVAIGGIPERLVMALCKPDFRHCWYAEPHGPLWTVVDPGGQRLDIAVYSDAAYQLYLREQLDRGVTVLSYWRTPSDASGRYLGVVTCSSIVACAMELRGRWRPWTPRTVWRALLARGAEPLKEA